MDVRLSELLNEYLRFIDLFCDTKEEGLTNSFFFFLSPRLLRIIATSRTIDLTTVVISSRRDVPPPETPRK